MSIAGLPAETIPRKDSQDLAISLLASVNDGASSSAASTRLASSSAPKPGSRPAEQRAQRMLRATHHTHGLSGLVHIEPMPDLRREIQYVDSTVNRPPYNKHGSGPWPLERPFSSTNRGELHFHALLQGGYLFNVLHTFSFKTSSQAVLRCTRGPLLHEISSAALQLHHTPLQHTPWSSNMPDTVGRFYHPRRIAATPQQQPVLIATKTPHANIL